MSTSQDTAPARTRRPGLPWWQAILAGAAAATVVNLAILFIARGAGAALQLTEPNGAPHPITAGGVVVSSVVPMTVGVLLATLLALRWPVFLRVAQVVGGGLGLLSVYGPLTGDTDGGTRAALSAMHIVVAIATVLTLEAIRRRRRHSHMSID